MPPTGEDLLHASQRASARLTGLRMPSGKYELGGTGALFSEIAILVYTWNV